MHQVHHGITSFSGTALTADGLEVRPLLLKVNLLLLVLVVEVDPLVLPGLGEAGVEDQVGLIVDRILLKEGDGCGGRFYH